MTNPKPKVIDFNDPSTRAARFAGRNDLLPDNVVVRSPYGKVGDSGQTADLSDQSEVLTNKDAKEVLGEIMEEQSANEEA